MQADAQEVAPPVNLKERRPSVADRNIENASTEVPEIPDELERVLVFALDEAKEKIEGGEDVIPFTTLVVKDNLFIESHPGDSAEECFEAAEKNVRGARGRLLRLLLRRLHRDRRWREGRAHRRGRRAGCR